MPPALWGDKNYVLALCLLPFPVPVWWEAGRPWGPMGPARLQLLPPTAHCDLSPHVMGMCWHWWSSTAWRKSPIWGWVLISVRINSRGENNLVFAVTWELAACAVPQMFCLARDWFIPTWNSDFWHLQKNRKIWWPWFIFSQKAKHSRSFSASWMGMGLAGPTPNAHPAGPSSGSVFPT